METKYCIKCDKTLSIECFSKKGKTRCHKCKSCQRAYSKEHYQNNRSNHLAKVKKYKNKVREFIRDFKTINPCTDCRNYFHFSMMDFDHLEFESKKFNIANTEHHSFPQIMQELQKCELVCSNCHRFRTWERMQSSQ